MTIRRASWQDTRALRRLAELDHQAPLRGEILVAELDGALWAARSLSEGRDISDPFRPAAQVRALLRVRAVQLTDSPTGSVPRWPPALRRAPA